MKNRKCPSHKVCVDYDNGNCQNCVFGDKIIKLHKQIDRLKKQIENLHASCTELTRKLECANINIELKDRICESYMLQYGTVADKNVFLKKERADTVKEMQEKLIYTLCINNEENTEFFDYAYTLETIDQIAKEILEGT